ncbi:MAG: hypothetical protein WCJ01_00830 [Ignavibacteria bacterium]
MIFNAVRLRSKTFIAFITPLQGVGNVGRFISHRAMPCAIILCPFRANTNNKLPIPDTPEALKGRYTLAMGNAHRKKTKRVAPAGQNSNMALT